MLCKISCWWGCAGCESAQRPTQIVAQELYLSPRAAAARGGGARPREHSHFRLRRAAAAASTQDIAAAALPTVPAELSINISNQVASKLHHACAPELSQNFVTMIVLPAYDLCRLFLYSYTTTAAALSVLLQAGYSEKLASREETVAVSTAAAAPSEAAPSHQQVEEAAEQLPVGLAPPLRSPRGKPATQEVDMFLSSKPVQRPAAVSTKPSWPCGGRHSAKVCVVGS